MRIQLTGGDYRARGLIAAAQKCVNLFAEEVPPTQGEEAQYAYLQTPGLVSLTGAPDFTKTTSPVRGLYQASSGQVFAVIGPTVYLVQLKTVNTIALVSIGTVANLTTPVQMGDNGIILVIVDGIVGHGWFVKLNTAAPTVQVIYDDNWYGSTSVAYLDTLFLFNRPGTSQFFVSPSNWDGNLNGLTGDALDGTYIAAKATAPDLLSAVAVAGQAIYLIGQDTTEIWYNSGAADFPFQRVAGVLINHGTKAPYSVAVGSVPNGQAALFWLGNDSAGKSIVFQGVGYQTSRVSTHALEAEFADYAVTADATAYCYQEEGHFFYILSFPTADRTWCYDTATGFWHERTFTAADGSQHMHRSASAVNSLGFILAGDYANGSIYQLTKDAFTDAGNPITRTRSFPHMISDGKRVRYTAFTANMTVGTIAGNTPLTVDLSWSNDRGANFGNPVSVSLGSSGQTNVWPTVWRLGLARDRIFELSWSGAAETSLLGAFLDLMPGTT